MNIILKKGLKIKHKFDFSKKVFEILQFNKEFVIFADIESGEIFHQTKSAFDKTKFVEI